MQHILGTLESSRDGGPVLYVWTCSCGRSDWRKYQTAADAFLAGQDHFGW